MIYKTTQCPHCGFYLEYRNTTNHPEYVPSALPCPKCGNMFMTGKKMWYEMSEKEKKLKNGRYYDRASCIYAFINNLLAMLFIVSIPVALILIGSKVDSKSSMIVAGILGFLIAILLTPSSIKKEREQFEIQKSMTYEQFLEKYLDYYSKK